MSFFITAVTNDVVEVKETYAADFVSSRVNGRSWTFIPGAFANSINLRRVIPYRINFPPVWAQNDPRQ